jgi:hypothetical protein
VFDYRIFCSQVSILALGTTHSHLVQGVKYADLHFNSPVQLNDVVRNEIQENCTFLLSVFTLSLKFCLKLHFVGEGESPGMVPELIVQYFIFTTQSVCSQLPICSLRRASKIHGSLHNSLAELFRRAPIPVNDSA